MSCKSSSLIYSETGCGKTGMVGSFAKWIKQTYDKKIRLYTAEPGGLGTIRHLIDSGLIDVWDLTQRANFFETMDFASRGFWPDPKDAAKLIAPSPQDSDIYGGYAYEGATAFGELALDELRVKGAANEIIGAEKAPQQFISGSLKIAGNNQTHYGIVQSRVRKAINDSQRLSVHILWTARELKVRDDDDPKKQFVYGPLLAGSAATLNMPAWFGNCIHLAIRKIQVYDAIKKTTGTKLERRAFFTRHYDEGSEVPYLAQLRLTPELSGEMPESMEVTSDLLTMCKLYDKLAELAEKGKKLI